jgi:outer membrane protein TolC
MKHLLLYTLLLFALFVNAQTYDLDYYLTNANNNSPLINKTQNNNKLIRLDIQRVKSILSKPLVNVEGNLIFAPIISHDNGNKLQLISQGANSYNGYDLSYYNGGQYTAVVSINQPLFLGKTYNAYSKKADVQTQLNDNNIELSKHELEQLVSQQYLLCLMAKQQSQISKSLLEKLNKQLDVMYKLVENAIYKQTDLLLMQIEIENFKVEYEKYLYKYSKNLADLNIICGINDTITSDLKDVNFEIRPDTILHSQFMDKFKYDSLNIITSQSVFDQRYRPQLSLFADAGLNAIYSPTINRMGFAAGINFSWNIYDGNQKKIQHSKSKIELQTVEFEKNNFITQRTVNKEKYLNQIKAIDKQMKIVENQLLQYEKLVNIYQSELTTAQISIMDFKNLVRDISAKNQEYLQLKMHKQILISSYNYWNY